MTEPRVRVPDLREKKRRGEKIAVLTAYDATMAACSTVPAWMCCWSATRSAWWCSATKHTLPVTLDDMLHHTRAVARGARHALVVADMPFMTYQVSVEEAVRNAGRLVQAGAAAVKVEGGPAVTGAIRRMVEVAFRNGSSRPAAAIGPSTGRLRRQAMQREDVEALVEDAHALERAGVFAIVLEASATTRRGK
jgi:3-methyl-2-oxobutanoate hydroxymethyltransferase